MIHERRTAAGGPREGTAGSSIDEGETMRFVGERRALAAAVLAFFMIQLFLTGLLVDGQLRLLFLALGLAYGTGFVGIVAGYFWARWYALGLAFSGMTMAVTAI